VSAHGNTAPALVALPLEPSRPGVHGTKESRDRRAMKNTAVKKIDRIRLKTLRNVPKLGLMKFNVARIHPQKLIAWDSPKLREIEIEAKHENGKKKTQ
jgi:hypothetical protein